MMNAEQYRKAIAKLNLTAITAATVIGVKKRQSFRYASGDTPVPLCVSRLLWLLQRYGIPQDWR